MRTVSTLGFLLLVPFTGCDAAESLLEQIANEADARQAMSAMLAALSDHQPSEQKLSDAVHRGAGDGDKIVDLSHPCAGGGSVNFEGTLNLENLGTGLPGDDYDPLGGDPIPTGDVVPSIGFTYEVHFDGCTTEGVTLDGTVSYDLETDWDDAGSMFDANWDYSGLIEVTGDVTGSCEFAFAGLGDLPLENWGGGVPSGFDGDACGYDAQTLLDEG